MNGDDFTPFLIRQRNNVGGAAFVLCDQESRESLVNKTALPVLVSSQTERTGFCDCQSAEPELYLPSVVKANAGTASFLGKLALRFMKRRAKIVHRNLELCFPEMSEQERRKMVVKNFESGVACETVNVSKCLK